MSDLSLTRKCEGRKGEGQVRCREIDSGPLRFRVRSAIENDDEDDFSGRDQNRDNKAMRDKQLF
jgi:hypothetical protein